MWLKLIPETEEALKPIQSLIQEACREKTERDRKRGILNRPVRAMVVGHPQCGEIHIYQFVCGKGLRQDREQAGSDKGKTVDTPEQTSGTFRYARDSLAEI